MVRAGKRVNKNYQKQWFSFLDNFDFSEKRAPEVKIKMGRAPFLHFDLFWRVLQEDAFVNDEINWITEEPILCDNFA